MSKIRNHANLRLPTGFDLSKDFTIKKGERDLHDIEESHNEKLSNTRKDSEDASSRIEDHDIRNDDISSSPRKIFLSANNVDPRGIAEDLKNKLSLADRVIDKNHKNVEDPETKDENTKSSKIIHIFRKKYTLGSSCENTREKKSNNKHISCEIDEYRPNKHMSYENPTFILDSSLDSSVSSFFFENEQEEERKEEEQRRDFKSEYSESHDDKTLTVFVDSHKAATSRQFYPKENYKGDKDEDYLENEKARNAFRPRCETDPSKCLCETINRNSRASVMTKSQRTVESFAGFDHPEMKFYCKIHEIERRNVLNSLQDEKFLDNVKTCPSKSCKIRTVDNIANFWMNKRGSSFRNKMVANRKRDTKEAKDCEQVDQERVLVSTSSGSSTLHQ